MTVSRAREQVSRRLTDALHERIEEDGLLFMLLSISDFAANGGRLVNGKWGAA